MLVIHGVWAHLQVHMDNREQATAQPISGSIRDEKKTHSGHGHLLETRRNGHLLFLEKIKSGANILGVNFGEKCVGKPISPCNHHQGFSNGSCKISVVFGQA